MQRNIFQYINEYSSLAFLLADLQHKMVDYAAFQFDPDRISIDDRKYIANNHLEFVGSFEINEKIFLIYCNSVQIKKTLGGIIHMLIERILNFRLGQLIYILFAYFGIYMQLLQPVLFKTPCKHWILDVLGLTISVCTSSIVASKIRYYPFCGYWKYFATPLNKGNDMYDDRVRTDILRIVEISANAHGLHLQGWRAGLDQNCNHFSSEFCEVCYADNSRRSGALLYWFSSKTVPPISHNMPISGLTQLRWEKSKRNPKIDTMHGTYAGIESKKIGEITYSRISKAEFERLKARNFSKATLQVCQRNKHTADNDMPFCD